MTQTTVEQGRVCGLWDAGELISLHLTVHDADDARETHLARYLDFSPAEQALAHIAVEVRPVRLHHDAGTLDDPGRTAITVHDGPDTGGET